MHTAACKEFYANLTMFHYKKHEVARSRVRGVDIEFDSMRRRDEEEAALVENEEVNEEEELQQDFDWEAVIDEAALQGESGSDDKFYDAEVEIEEPAAEAPAVPVFPASPGDSTNMQKEPATLGVDPSAPTGSISDSVFGSLQVDFERTRANRIKADLKRAQAENGRLLALLQQV
ncbi:hypothetical protein Dimus_031748 [Dionaea muscipula]